MAHSCPICGQTCYCNGDIDDIIMDTVVTYCECIHCEETPEEDELRYYDLDMTGNTF